MDLIDQILEGLVCLRGEEGEDFDYYETLLKIMKRIDMLNPYRNSN